MDRNFFLAIALSLLVLLVWSNFEAQRREGLEPPPGETTESAAPPESRQPGDPPGEVSRPQARPPAAAPTPLSPSAPPAPAAPALTRLEEQRVELRNDLWEAVLSTRGGGLVSWKLKDYVDKSVAGEPQVELVTLDAPDQVAVATPLSGLGFGDLSRADYTIESQDSRSVVFARELEGVKVTKSFLFEPDSYAFRVRISVENGSPRPVAPTFEIVWPMARRDGPDFTEQSMLVMDQGSLERRRLDAAGGGGLFSFGATPMEGETFPRGVEWAGAELRYFLSVFLPEVPRDAGAAFLPLEASVAANVAIDYRPTEIPPGQNATREYRAFIGPKLVDQLEPLGSDLDEAINQGWAWMSPLTSFFSWTLRVIYSVVPNYGVAIILLTILVRVVTAPLTSRQMRSMKKMSALQPRMKELQEKYKDDRQKQSEEMMKMYKETGVNPLGGCLPLVLQFPVFIGLYYALQSSIELRQAPFFGWINDLSSPEELFTIPGLDLPVRVLPIIMGASMILQQRMTPTTMDPAQARMMMTVMPVMFTVLFYQFPSGLVLYWMVSNLLAIGHQMWVNRQPDPA